MYCFLILFVLFSYIISNNTRVSLGKSLICGGRKDFVKRYFSFPVQCFSTGRGFYFPQNPNTPFLLFSLLSSSSLISSVCWKICRSSSSDSSPLRDLAYIRNARASAQNESSSRGLILSTVHEVIFSGVRWFILIRPRNFVK